MSSDDRPFTRYQEIVLRDVQNPRYATQARRVWIMFGALGAAFVALYVGYFHLNVWRYVRFIRQTIGIAIASGDPGFRSFVYSYLHLIGFVAFLGFAAVLAVLALLAYDMQARNGIIRDLIASRSEKPAKVSDAG